MNYVSYGFQFLSFAIGMVSLYIAFQLFNQYKFSYLKNNIFLMVGYILLMLFNSIGSLLNFSHPGSGQSLTIFNKLLFFIIPLILLFLTYHFRKVFSGIIVNNKAEKTDYPVILITSVFLIFHIGFAIKGRKSLYFLPIFVMLGVQLIFFLMIFQVLNCFRKEINLLKVTEWKLWLRRIWIAELVYFIVLLMVIITGVANLISQELLMVFTSFLSMVINPLMMWLFVKYHNVRYGEKSDCNENLYLFYEITDREKEIIAQLCQGKTNKEIADLLFLSPLTVRDHLSNIYRKTGVNNRIKLAKVFSGT